MTREAQQGKTSQIQFMVQHPQHIELIHSASSYYMQYFSSRKGVHLCRETF